MGLLNIFDKKSNPDEIIKKLNVICISYDSPIQKNFSEELTSNVLYELYVFHYVYAWLYNMDNNLIKQTKLNILKFHLIANRLLNDVCKKSFSDEEFNLMFQERFANYRQELSLVRKHQFDGGHFPTYFYDRIFKKMLQENNLDATQEHYHRNWTRPELARVYNYSVNYMHDELEKVFK